MLGGDVGALLSPPLQRAKRAVPCAASLRRALSAPRLGQAPPGRGAEVARRTLQVRPCPRGAPSFRLRNGGVALSLGGRNASSPSFFLRRRWCGSSFASAPSCAARQAEAAAAAAAAAAQAGRTCRASIQPPRLADAAEWLLYKAALHSVVPFAAGWGAGQAPVVSSGLSAVLAREAGRLVRACSFHHLRHGAIKACVWARDPKFALLLCAEMLPLGTLQNAAGFR